VLYDGVCGFCNGSVRWLIARDRDARLSYAPLQGETAAALRVRHPEIPVALDAIVFVETDAGGSRVSLRSAALLRVLRELPAPWRWLAALGSLLPRSLGDAAYDAFARRRYRWFGRLDACPVPPAALRARFLA
jgi:predicted DCC family thiol-disulfide oxidoreductase YuxK